MPTDVSKSADVEALARRTLDAFGAVHLLRNNADVAYVAQHGMPPAQVADIVFDAIRDETFYILTHATVKERVSTRMEDIIEERTPTPPTPAPSRQGAG